MSAFYWKKDLRTVNFCHYSHISHAYWKKHTHGSCFIYLFFILVVYAMPWPPTFLFIAVHGSSLASGEFMANNGMLYDLETEVNPSLSGLSIFFLNASPDKIKVQRLGMASVSPFVCSYLFFQICLWIIYLYFLRNLYGERILLKTKNYKRPNHAQKKNYKP